MPDLSGHTVLVLHAHPDDEAIFSGLTLRRLADAGARTVLVLGTAGELGGSRVPLRPGETVPERRVAELEAAASPTSRRPRGRRRWCTTTTAASTAIPTTAPCTGSARSPPP
jgi:LmbE family N-acetylglucosaminyl deacetylase